MDNNMERGMETGIEQGHLEVYCFLVAILLVIIYDILNWNCTCSDQNYIQSILGSLFSTFMSEALATRGFGLHI